MELSELTIKEAHQKLRKKEVSSVELTQACLDRIEKKDKDINAFLTITSELAISQAKEIDRKIQKGEEISILAGIPSAIKDNILIEGLKCTAASRILENYLAFQGSEKAESSQKIPAGIMVMAIAGLSILMLHKKKKGFK